MRIEPAGSAPHYLFLLPSFNVGGAEKILVWLSNRMAAAGQAITLGILDDRGALRDQVDPRVNQETMGVRRARYALPAVVSLIRRQHPDVVLSTLSRMNLLILLARPFLPRGTRVILREANVPSSDLQSLRWSGLYRLLYRMLYPTADTIICQSMDMYRDLHENFGVAEERLLLIHNPAVVSASTADDPLESPYPDGTNILAVGRLAPQKGYDILLQAFAQLRDRGSSARLTILGDGEEKQKLLSMARSLGIENAVQFAGFVAQTAPYYKYADLVVLASRWEGFPNVLVEALSVGVPVVATDAPGGSSEIVVDGENGFLVPVDQPAALSEAMTKAIHQQEFKDKERIRSSIDKFSEESIFRKYLEELQASR